LLENPIQSIHDQGAGGNGNVLKEIVEPNGATIYTKAFTLGDPTIDTIELWSAEYQESNAILIYEKDKTLLQKISLREKCPIDFVGHITDDGLMRLIEGSETSSQQSEQKKYPVNLDLSLILANMPKKTFKFTDNSIRLKSLTLPPNLGILEALNRVLRLVSVGSKRFLTNKVDRSVSGLIVQQQCVGPLQVPLADYAMIALSYFDTW